jgi:hypothetical protein
MSLTETTTLVDALLQHVPPDQAFKEFVFFFFGGSGALGIGAAQVPKLLAENDKRKALAGGPTKGGEALDLNPVAASAYPEPLRVADVKEIMTNLPSVEKILNAGPKSSYMATMGYLERDGLNACLPNANPVVLCAVFDCISGGADLAAPNEANAKFSVWQSEAQAGKYDSFKGALFTAYAKKLSAFTVFAGLIALVLDLIFESGMDAYFPVQ